ncbi:MAG: FG-GAP-like repeat-containing protein, partial [Bacteroidota bacterium]
MKSLVTACFALAFMATTAWAQDTEYLLNVPNADDPLGAYATGLHSGARDISGPHDLDNDGQPEILLADYTGGGRVHVIENRGADTWELVFTTPVLDSTSTTNNMRAVAAGDLDGDGFGEIVFLAGRGYSEFNPNADTYVPGLYVFEAQGDDNYGDAPASIYAFDDDLPDRWRAERIRVMDVDGDDVQEVMFGNNGGDNRYDNWYVLSVSGDIGSGFEFWTVELRLSSRGSEEFDPVTRGGGSPYDIIPADVNGDGQMDLVMHSWNNYNFTMATATGADAYVAGDSTAANVFVQASDADQVAFFGGTPVDLDGDGNDEVVFGNLQSADVSVINFDEGASALEITADNVGLGIIEDLTALGIAHGDLDGDGQMEIFGSGPGYSAEAFADGEMPAFVRATEFIGGDVLDPASYDGVQVFDIGQDFDMAEFDLVRRDSAGVMTEFFEAGVQGAAFVSKFAYLGDADGDGFNELAVAFQGVDDSTFVYNEVFNPADSTYTRTVESVTVNENRVFMRVLTGTAGFSVDVEDERVIVPSDYKLDANYPNPFNPTTSFSFTLPIDKQVSVKVFDLNGRLVDTLVDN